MRNFFVSTFLLLLRALFLEIDLILPINTHLRSKSNCINQPLMATPPKIVSVSENHGSDIELRFGLSLVSWVWFDLSAECFVRYSACHMSHSHIQTLYCHRPTDVYAIEKKTTSNQITAHKVDSLVACTQNIEVKQHYQSNVVTGSHQKW